ncbi:MAG: hypothetical protein Q7U35_09605 [Methanobacteriaceae archaeon]|nr:hypothetical protein [Methanobacteriaceae archaeon]MDP2836983.1 hypothetical protein [Methanobacteriaceae archaeon]
MGSYAITLVASLGPRFVAVRVKVTFCPEVRSSVWFAVFIMARSAAGIKLLIAVALLFNVPLRYAFTVLVIVPEA